MRSTRPTPIVSLVLLSLLTHLALPHVARADESCPSGVAPVDATAAPAAAIRHYRRIATRQKVPMSIGTSSSISKYCVTRNAVFYEPAWLGIAELEASPDSGVGHAALAYIAGRQSAHLLRTTGGVEPDADLAGARAAGCALAAAGVRGDAVNAIFDSLQAMTAPHAEADKWRAAFTRGVEACIAG